MTAATLRRGEAPAATLAAEIRDTVRRMSHAAPRGGLPAARTPLDRLSRLFRLDARERDLLETCLAAAVDPTLGTRFAALPESGGRGHVTDPLVASLFGHPSGRVWNPAGPLALWQLVRAQPVGPGEPDALAVDPAVPAWLGGELWIDRPLAGLIGAAAPALQLVDWPIESVALAARQAMANGSSLRVLIQGAVGSGRVAFAAAVAETLGLQALKANTDAIDDADWPDIHVRLQRLAAVGGSALVWTGSRAMRPWPSLVAPAPLHLLAVEPGQSLPPDPRLQTLAVELPELSTMARRALWLALVPAAATWPADALDQLASRYRLGAGALIEIAADRPATPAIAAQAARGWNRRTADEIVHSVPCPFAWDDLVVTAALKESLADYAFEAAERERVREQGLADRLMVREASLAALFCGPSGTGKTMAAQVIAAHLGLDLLRVDMAAITSKYIGETAKNLNRVFALARGRQAILLFDEADSQFARRTEVKDAHDRYANGDTNHLLQLLEMHRGLVILATNRRSDLDPAFVRRLRYVMEFVQPQVAERRELWRRAVLAAATPERCAALAPAVDALAEAVEVSGAQIRNAVLSALFMARREAQALGFAHLLRGLDRELVKDGRPLSPRERERWLQHA